MAIATLAEAKVHLNIPDNKSDARLQIYLDALEDWVAGRFNQFGLQVEQKQFTELKDGGVVLQHEFSPTIRQFRREFPDPPTDLPVDHLITNFRPIVSVTSVHESVAGPNQVFDATSLIDNTDYVVKNRQGIVQLINGLRFDRGPQSIQIIYDAGFQPVPNDIKMAVLLGVDQLLSKAGRGGVKSERLGEYSYAIKEAERLDEDLMFFLRRFLKDLMVKGA